MSFDFKYFTGHTKTASLHNINEAVSHFDMSFITQEDGSIIYK